MKKMKNIITLVISLLIVIIVLQNTQSVETELLFMKVTMPRALLLFITLLVGFVVGIVTTSHFMTKSPGSTKKAS
ncbi:MAG: lipopolysaccharide assembly protein LapA domain-containing protein [Planctomycetota bacterium]|jgi:uncharacterized integral membrane protein